MSSPSGAAPPARSEAWRRAARRRTPAPRASRRRPSPRARGTRRCGPPGRRAAATAASCAPPSTSTRVSPACAQCRQRGRRIDARLGPGDLDQRDAEIGEGVAGGRGRCRRGSASRSAPRAAVATSVAVSGVRRWLSATTRTTGAGAEAGEPAGQLRVVRQHRADADHHRVVPAAQRMRRAARGRAGDPLALARPRWRSGHPASRQASASPAAGPWRTRGRKPAASSSASARSTPSSTAMPAARSRAMPGAVHPRVRVARGDHHAGDAGRRSARRCRAACGPSGSRAPA